MEPRYPRRGEAGLDAGLETPAPIDPYCEEAALHAGTLNNHFKPVPMTGGGLPDARREAYDHHLSRPPHTGMVYTPPQYSDHIAISLVIDRRAMEQVCRTVMRKTCESTL